MEAEFITLSYPISGAFVRGSARGCSKNSFSCVVFDKGIHQPPLFGTPKRLFAGRIPPLPYPLPPCSRGERAGVRGDSSPVHSRTLAAQLVLVRSAEFITQGKVAYRCRTSGHLGDKVKIAASGRLRSGWASRRGRYTSDWSASERTCANNWRNRGEIPSQSPLGGTQVWLWRLINC